MLWLPHVTRDRFFLSTYIQASGVNNTVRFECFLSKWTMDRSDIGRRDECMAVAGVPKVDIRAGRPPSRKL